MKGVELLAMIIAFFFLFAITFILGSITIYVENVVRGLGFHKSYSMVVSPIHLPVKYELMLLSYLETTEHRTGIPPKKILTAAATENTTTYIYIDGEIIHDLPQFTENIFGIWMGEEAYLLILDVEGYERVIAGNKNAFALEEVEAIRVKKVSTEIFSPIHKSHLDLYVR